MIAAQLTRGLLASRRGGRRSTGKSDRGSARSGPTDDLQTETHRHADRVKDGGGDCHSSDNMAPPQVALPVDIDALLTMATGGPKEEQSAP